MRIKLALLTLSLLSFSALAQAKKKGFIRLSESNFPVTKDMVQAMLKEGKSFYSVNLMNREEFFQPSRKAFLELDYMGQSKLKNNSYLVSKHVYLLNRPADFFSCELLENIKYIRALEKESVTRVGPLNYLMKGEQFMVYKYQFDLNWFADLQDCKNLVTEGSTEMNDNIAKLKTFDKGITYPLHGTYLKDKPNFTQFLTSGWIFAKIHRIEQKTLMITYEVSAMPSEYAIKNIVENGHIQVMELEEKANSEFKPSSKSR